MSAPEEKQTKTEAAYYPTITSSIAPVAVAQPAAQPNQGGRGRRRRSRRGRSQSRRSRRHRRR